jgi:colanic acid biosynthesis glycosyl transferase WcaI
MPAGRVSQYRGFQKRYGCGCVFPIELFDETLEGILSKVKRMRILIYSVNFSPEPTGIGKYSGEMAAWLAEQGHEIRVIAAPPYYPAWRLAPGYRWPPFRRERMLGVEVWRAPIWVPESPGGLTRTLHLMSFAFSSFPLMMLQVLWRPDVVVTVAPAFMCAPAGLLTALLSGAKAWLHLQDFEIDVAFQMGLLKGKWLQRVALRAERWLLRRFDTVSTISSRMLERLLMKGVAPERTCYFPNWVDVSSLRSQPSRESYRAALGISEDAVVALFSGSLGGKQGLAVIPAAAALLRSRQDLVFVVCGDGVMKPALEAASAALSNFHLIPLQPVERLQELLSMADIHLMPQSPDAADLVLPSKLSGMLASGRPVVATCRAGTEIAEIVSHCGMVVPPEDAAGLAAAVTALADDPGLRRELGQRARDIAEARFERDATLRRVFGGLDERAEVAENAVVH